jgi:hypothetical protein
MDRLFRHPPNLEATDHHDVIRRPAWMVQQAFLRVRDLEWTRNSERRYETADCACDGISPCVNAASVDDGPWRSLFSFASQAGKALEGNRQVGFPSRRPSGKQVWYGLYLGSYMGRRGFVAGQNAASLLVETASACG